MNSKKLKKIYEESAKKARKEFEEKPVYYKRIEQISDKKYKEYIDKLENAAKNASFYINIDMNDEECIEDSNYDWGVKIDYGKNKYTEDCNIYHRVNCRCDLYEKDIIDYLRNRFKEDGFKVSGLEYAYKHDCRGYIEISIL